MSEQKTILVLGATGMLGHKICLTFAREPGLTVYAASKTVPSAQFLQLFQQSGVTCRWDLDATNFASVERLLVQLKPDFVINCIGIIKQRAEAEDPVQSIQINALLPHLLDRSCQQLNSRLIHFSTDCVFSGQKGQPYQLSDPSDAGDLYGKTKFLGETKDSQALTLRTSIIGRETSRHTGLLDWFRSQQGKKVSGFDRALYSGLTTNLAAELVLRILRDHPSLKGLYQVAANPISKYDLLTIINRTYKLGVTIDKETSFTCDRRLDGRLFYEATGWIPPSWEVLTQQMFEQDARLYGHYFDGSET